jgi:hypothetical protein
MLKEALVALIGGEVHVGKPLLRKDLIAWVSTSSAGPLGTRRRA